VDPERWWGRQPLPDRDTFRPLILSAKGAAPVVLHAEGQAQKVVAHCHFVLVRGNEGVRARIDLMEPVRGAGRSGQVRWVSERLALGARAAEAILRAFRAATALLPHQLPPHPIEAVPIRITCLEGGTVDGPSLGLPLALAFLSQWSGRPLPEGLYATGELDETGAVLPVDGIGPKRAALKEGDRLFCPPGNSGAGLDPVATLREAATMLGLLPLPALQPIAIGRAAVEDRLREAVRNANCQRYAAPTEDGQVHPGSVLGESILFLVGHLLQQKDPLRGQRATDLLSSLSTAQVTFSHAADHGGRCRAEQMAGEIRRSLGDRAVSTDDALRADLDRLWAAIDEQGGGAGGLAETERLIDRVLGQFERSDDPAAHRWLTYCTTGRACLHARQLPRAVELLQEARDAADDQDRARTGIYLAMALREAGDLAGADETLRFVAIDITDHTLPYDEHYAQQTKIFWSYERARLALAQGDSRSSLVWARTALALGPTLWPKLGILRTLAWAWNAQNNVGNHRSVAATAKQLLEDSGIEGPYRVILGRVVDEARGAYQRGGEVY
jgi:tetratricopeptide (TPR) repeat protein